MSLSRQPNIAEVQRLQGRKRVLSHLRNSAG